MAVNVTRTSSLFTDSDSDGVADPGETLLVHILIENATAADIVNLKVYDSQNGLTIDAGTIQITPIAFDDFSAAAPLTIVGNTPYIVSASALLGNDVDVDGLHSGLDISGFTNLNHVTVTDVGGGNFQIVPETGYQGVASFQYTITDEDGLASVSTGTVHIQVSGQVWYVDNAYAGANGASDGSYLKPFTSLGQLNDDGTGGAGTVGLNDGVKGDDDVDGAGDTIFVYNRGTTYTGGITLEAGQKLHGDGHEMTVNGFAIGTPGQTANSTVNYSTYGVTLGTDNTISGLNLNGTANSGVGIQDGNGSVTTASGTLNVSNVALSGSGQAVDIDQGGNLNVALTSLSSTGTASGPAVQLAGTAGSGTSLISGTFTASGGSIAGEAGHGFQIGGQGPSSGGTIGVTYGGTIGSSTTGSAVNIADRISGAGDVTFSGNITQTSTASNTSAGIAISNVADGNISFTGTKTINVTGGAQNAIQIGSVSGDTDINFSGGAIDIDFAAGTTGHAFSISAQSGTSTIDVSTAADVDMVGSASGRGISILNSTAGSVNFTGGNLTISTRDGDALFDSNSAGSTNSLNISGSGNTLTTTNGGQLVEISNAATTGMTFNTLTTGSAVNGTGVQINNLDGGSFNTTTINVTGTSGAGADGIRIEGGSSTTFNLGTVGTTNISDDGIELNGANGAVTIDSISVQNTILGQGVEINGATNAVTITAGGIGSTNDSAAEGVLITGGSGNVTVGATVTKITAGNVVEVTGHTGGAVSFSNTISATGAVDNGILLTNNTGGTIAFGGNVTLTTGGNDALTFTNTAGTGAAVSFTGGNLAITTTGAGDGVFATSTNVGAGSLTITGANNTISTVNGAALTVDDVRIGSTGIALKSVNVTDASGYGIFLDNTGTTAGTHGGLTITGDATASKTAGGTITGADNAGISISNARDIVLDQMTVQNGLDDGVRLSNVTNFSLTQANIVNNGDAQNEHGVDASNVTGTVRFTDITLTNNEHEQVHYNNNAVGATSADIEFNNVDIAGQGLASNANASHGINLTADGASSMDVRIVNGSSFNNLFSNSFQTQNEGTGTLEITVSNTTFTNVGASAINIAQNDSGTVRFNIFDNGTAAAPTFLRGTNNGVSASININQAGGTPAGAILEGKISNNYIGDASSTTSATSSGDGIRVLSVGSGTTNVQIDNNTIRGVGTNGINVQMSEDPNAAHTMNVTIFNNNVTVSDVNSFDGIRVVAGAQSTDAGVLRLDMHDNTASSATGNDFTVRQRFQTTVELLNLGSNNASEATVENYLDVTRNNNPTGAGTNWFITHNLAGAPAGGGFDNTNSVTAPTLPAPIILKPDEGFAVPKDSPVQAAPPAGPGVVDGQGGTPGTGGQTVTDPLGGNMPIVGAPTPPQAGPAEPGPVVVDDGKVSQAELDLLVAAAIERWAAAGATPEQIATMKAVNVTLTDMMGVQIGGATPGAIHIDTDGGGHGWFVDATPGDDSEFAGSGTRLKATATGGAAGEVDLLTVLMHELGHQIGLDDSYLSAEVNGLMYGYVDIGERRLPAAGEAAEGDGHAPTHEAYLLSPVADIGTLPAGKSVDIRFQATIDSYFNQIISTLVNSANVKGDGGLNQDSNTNVTTLDTLTLGNLVFLDVNKDGDYDAGTDTGIVGVTVDLYADTNGDNAWDGGDAFLATTTTLAGGLYSFTGLSAGNYIVVVKSTNFDSGGVLEDLLITPGTAVDPDNNADNDNNGAAATGGAVAAAPISLAYNQEPTAGTGNDTNNTVDFGFVENDPPVANDDPGLTATEDEAKQYSTELTGNDTDPDAGDTITIVSAGNATNGSVSVSGGVVTFTPTANFNGTATFEYTIDDGHGNQDTAVATVTVGAVNDPVTTAAPGTASLNEDSVDFAVTGLSIADVDSALAPAGVYQVTLSATQGTLKLTETTGLDFSIGDGDGDTTMTFSGTLADINTALATAKYTPNANYNGSAQIQLQATDTVGGVSATGTGAATNDSDTIVVTVNSVNDEPAGTDDNAEVIEAEPYEFLPTDFSAGFSDLIDNNSFAGVKITELPLTGTLKLNGTAINAGDTITLAQLTAGDFTYESPAGSAGNSPTFKFAVQDNGGNANGGVEYDQSPNTFTLNIVPADIAPVLDLDADGAGTGFAASYTEGAAAASISDTDVLITDADAGDQVEGATITITNAVAGDVLTVVGALPGAITVHASSTATNLVLTGTGTQAQYAAAIEQITFSSSSDDPTALGTNMSRTIEVTVTDGDLPSNVAVTTINVTDVNDAPAGTNATIIATEDSFRLLAEADFGTVDADGSFATVTISAVTGGGIYVDSDGSAGAGGFVLETLPKTYSKQDLIDGKVAFKANPDLNGAGAGTITFAVTDNDGATDGSPNILTVDVTAVNDSPVLAPSPAAVSATEQTAVAILPGKTVADVDLDARNGGNGDYAGSSLTVHRNAGANAEDVFSVVAGANFTVDGNNLKTTGGQIFATISTNSGGTITIDFTSAGAAATSALVDQVIQAIRYTNSSNNPPASVVLAYDFDDGSPGGGQGAGASDTDSELVTVNIAGVNDAPVNTLGGAIGTIEDAVDAWLSGMSISDPDADPATDEIVVTFDVDHATLEIRTDVAGGIVAGDIVSQDADTITVKATLNEINATLAANNGLTYSPDANYFGPDTLTVTTNDQGNRGTDPGLSGNGTSEQDIDTRSIDVQAQPDAPIAQPDAISTAENVIGTGSLFNNNGSGPDTDADGDMITVSEVNGSAVDVGQEITLASGAKLKVNSDGTYTYNPNGKFNRLTDNTSGAVNTSTVGDTFSYTVTGGNTVTVTVTVNGVAGPGDWLMGNGAANTITGTPQVDTFVVSQGGNDTISALAGKDIIYFGGALTADDNVTGGADVDTIVLQGDYSAGLVLDGSITGIEHISMLAGTNTAFGDSGTLLYDYVLTTHDDNFAAGVQARINGGALLAGEDFTFNGSAETDAKFVVYGGRGTDDLTGGDGNDIFFFAEGGRFAEGDTVDGGDGYDGLFLRGNYTIDFTDAGWAGAISSLENLTLSSASDERYGRGGGSEFDYDVTWDDDLLANGATITVNGALLQANETMVFDGSDESDGLFKIFAGAADDNLTGGDKSDIIMGALGADQIRGGAGPDFFRYDFKEESTSAGRDEIEDFEAGDKVDLSKMDANANLGGNQAFTFIGNAAFSNVAGQLRYESAGGDNWLVQADTNGDSFSDFELLLVIANPLHVINGGDFIL